MHESIILKKTFADIVSVFFIISKIFVVHKAQTWHRTIIPKSLSSLTLWLTQTRMSITICNNEYSRRSVGWLSATNVYGRY